MASDEHVGGAGHPANRRRAAKPFWMTLAVAVLVGATASLLLWNRQAVPAANTATSLAELWDIPGLREEPASGSIFVLSDRIEQSLLACKEMVKTVSAGSGPTVDDEHRFARVRVLAVDGVQGRWKVTIYQAYAAQHAREIARSFFELNPLRAEPNLEWNEKRIGDVSAGHHARGMADEPFISAIFVRGNVAIAVHAEQGEDRKYPDPRPLAALLDSYLLKELKPEDDAKGIAAITLAVDKAGQTQAEPAEAVTAMVGEECSVRRAPDINMRDKDKAGLPVAGGTADGSDTSIAASEMRVQATNAKIVRQADKQIVVRFLTPGIQTVKCCYVSAEGKIVGYGKVEINVKDATGALKRTTAEPAAH